jgi:hypothetical protein
LRWRIGNPQENILNRIEKENYIKNKFEIIDDITKIFIFKKDGKVLETIVNTYIYYEKLKNFNVSWFAGLDKYTKTYYVRCSTHNLKDMDGKDIAKTLYLHRYIMNVNDKEYIDHCDHDTLNNLISNLRIIGKKENAENRSSINSNNTSGYRNVCWDKSRNKWIVQLQINGKNNILGIFEFDKLDKAGIFAKEMREKYYGKYAGF